MNNKNRHYSNIKFNKTHLSQITVYALLVSSTASIAALEPRDLDGDEQTVEAYYDDQLNITILTDGNLALTERFGMPAADIPSYTNDYSPYGIYSSGVMSRTTLAAWLAAMNASFYSGHNQWRLPNVDYRHDPIAFSVYENNELQLVLEQSASVFKNVSDKPYLTSGTGPNRYPLYYTIENQRVEVLPPRAPGATFAAWPVHDGDIGSAVTINECVDTDGDGWGWDGVSSCRISDYSDIDPAECVDTDGDGWGWNGVESCRMEAGPQGLTYLITTGEVIPEGKNLRWSKDDLAGQKVRCDDYRYYNERAIPNQYRRIPILYDIQESGDMRVTYHDPLEGIGVIADENWRVESDGSISGISVLSAPASATDEGYIFVQALGVPDANGNIPVLRYSSCGIDNGVLRATGDDNETSPCIDTDGDGWGWDGTKSCIP